MQELEKIFKALADKNRLRILKLLEKKDSCVCELVAIINISQSTISKHLKKMLAAGLIEAKQNGLWTEYQLNKKNIYVKKIFNDLAGWLNEDQIIIKDSKKAQKADRQKLSIKK